MNPESLNIYVNDAVHTLETVSNSFIVITKNFEENQKNSEFIKNNLKRDISLFSEFIFIDNILFEYLCVNLLSVVDYKQFEKRKRKDKDIADYDILKLANRIYGKEKFLNNGSFNYSQFKDIYDRIDSNNLLKIKDYRDKHYSHIDRNRKHYSDIFLRDLIQIINLFLEMFNIIYLYIKGKSIYDLVNENNLAEIKLRAFKYDMIMKSLEDNVDLNTDKLSSIKKLNSFERIWNWYKTETL